MLYALPFHTCANRKSYSEHCPSFQHRMTTTKPPKVKLVQFQELQLLKDIEKNGGKYQDGGFLSVWNANSDFYGPAASPLRSAFINRRDRYLRLTLKSYIQELIDKGIAISDATYQKALEKNILTGSFGEVVNELYDPSGKKQAEAAKPDRKSGRKSKASSSSSSSSSIELSSSEEESDSASQLVKSVASLSLKSRKQQQSDNQPLSTPSNSIPPRSSISSPVLLLPRSRPKQQACPVRILLLVVVSVIVLLLIVDWPLIVCI